MTQRERPTTLILGRRWRWSRPLIGLCEHAGHSQASVGIFRACLGAHHCKVVVGTVPFGLWGEVREGGKDQCVLFQALTLSVAGPEVLAVIFDLELGWPAAAPGLLS